MGYGLINSRPPAPPACPLLTMYELVHTLKQKFTTSKKHINGNRHIRHTHIAPKYSWY